MSRSFEGPPRVQGEYTTKKENYEGQPARVEKNWNAAQGFGFLRLQDGGRVFCHVNELCTHLRPQERGQTVPEGILVHVGEVRSTQKGLRAERVRCSDCAAPERWELQPSGREAFGIKEMHFVCVNKPYGTKPPDASLLTAANAPFRAAEEKEQRWKSSIDEAFFEEFGEPSRIEVITEEANWERRKAEDYLLLHYPHGHKKVPLYEAFESKHWRTSASSEWRMGEYGEIQIKFIFEDLPATHHWKSVATTGRSEERPDYHGHPALYQAFDLLPATIQDMILPMIRAAIRTPEELAQTNIPPDLKAALEKIHIDLRDARLPGEAYIYESAHKTQVRGSFSYGGETVYTDSYHDETVTSTHLSLGGLAGPPDEYRRSWHAYPNGEKIFEIFYGAKQTPEEARLKLIERLTQDLNRRFAEMEIKPPPADPRLYDLSSDEWKERFDRSFAEKKNALLEQWRIDDDAWLRQANERLNAYAQAANLYKERLETAHAIPEQAKKMGVSTYALHDQIIFPSITGPGKNSLEQLESEVEKLADYNQRADAFITQTLQARGERRLTEQKDAAAAAEALRQAMEAEAAPARWYVPPEFDTRVFEAFGRKPGEGFGEKVAGENLYLPGERGVVGWRFGGQTRRYTTEIRSRGLVPLAGRYLIEAAGKRTEDFLALIENQDWQICWMNKHDGEPYGFSLATAAGISHFTPARATKDGQGWYEDGYEAQGWDGTKGAGPSLEAVKQAVKKYFNLSFPDHAPIPDIEQIRAPQPARIGGLSTSLASKLRDALDSKPGDQPTSSTSQPVAKTRAPETTKELLTDTLRQRLAFELTVAQDVLDAVLADLPPFKTTDKLTDAQKKQAQLRSRATERLRDAKNIQAEIAASDDAARARGLAGDLVQRTAKLAEESARLHGQNPDWAERYRKILDMIPEIEQDWGARLSTEALRRLVPRLLELAKRDRDLASLKKDISETIAEGL